MMVDQTAAIQEAAYDGLKSMEHLIQILSHQPPPQSCRLNLRPEFTEVSDVTVAKFKQVISLLNRTGHARFRRGPKNTPPPFDSYSGQPDPVHNLPRLNSAGWTKSYPDHQPSLNTTKSLKRKASTESETELLSMTQYTKESVIITTSAAQNSFSTSSFFSSITGDSSVSNGKLGPSLFVAPTTTFSSGKPPISSNNRKKCQDHAVSGKTSSSGRCHCSKRRKLRTKRSIRVPAISSKTADIPADEYSWRKYGQKPIKGSPYPRGYYRCSCVRGCPARKHVERAQDEPTMLIVTYEGEHRHGGPQAAAAAAQPELAAANGFLLHKS